jgi:HEAT repeat protein
MQQGDVDKIETLVYLIYDSDQKVACRELLQELLLLRFHRSHQRVVFTLQALRDPRSVPILRQALAMPFDHLADYPCESEVIAKWFSHALADIGTPEAIQVLREFAQSPDPGIRAEMQYRLTKLSRWLDADSRSL